MPRWRACDAWNHPHKVGGHQVREIDSSGFVVPGRRPSKPPPSAFSGKSRRRLASLHSSRLLKDAFRLRRQGVLCCRTFRMCQELAYYNPTQASGPRHCLGASHVFRTKLWLFWTDILKSTTFSGPPFVRRSHDRPGCTFCLT